MNRILLIVVAASFAACAAPRYAEPAQLVGRSLVPPPGAAPEARSGLLPSEPDNDATRAWLDQEIERNRYVPPPPPPAPPVQTRIVYEREYVPYDDYGYGYHYDDHCVRHPYYGHGYYVRRHHHHDTRFPVNTVVGAGLGAIIGHQSGRRDRGAAIGAGVGLLFDLARW